MCGTFIFSAHFLSAGTERWAMMIIIDSRVLWRADHFEIFETRGRLAVVIRDSFVLEAFFLFEPPEKVQ
jgi:hypothetical protein